jgi:exodeoxyribonuclease V gamma subunit
MNGLSFHASNQLEVLAQRASSFMGRPGTSPLTPELVVVQSAGMERWLSLELARQRGICMNLEFLFPRTLVDRVLQSCFPAVFAHAHLSADAFSPETVVWRILKILPELIHRDSFSEVRRYFASGPTGFEPLGLKSYLWASKVAALFDNYLVYRPAMILRWERGESAEAEIWQADLWRALLGTPPAPHFASSLENLVAHLHHSGPGADIPERILVFGCTSLPPSYLKVLYALARHREIHHLALRPTQMYAGGGRTPKQEAAHRVRSLRQAPMMSTEPESPHTHPLLRTLGRLGIEQLDLQLELEDQFPQVAQGAEEFVEGPEPAVTLLQSLQNGLLHDTAPSCALPPQPGDSHPFPEERPAPFRVPEDDRSLTLHACHSPMREVEVLFDELLRMLDSDPTLQPKDILVLAPDIERYAPLVHAVFGSPEEERLAIPYDLADRVPRTEMPAVEAFLGLLALGNSRCTASEILALLDSAPFRARFEFDSRDLAQIRVWLVDSGIRWGRDAAHRESLQLPPFPEASWSAGLERLLLGLAMDSSGGREFHGIVPCDAIEGSRVDLFSRFLEATRALFEFAGELAVPRPIPAWSSLVNEAVARFFPGDEQHSATTDVRGREAVRSAIESVQKGANAAALSDPVGFDLVRKALLEHLERPRQRGRFLGGGITFCALQPMRCIPARVICVLGLDDGAFPRQPQPTEFDLIAQERIPGDRSARDDDRHLFLELLVSARERLWISYNGYSPRDQSESNPSVLVCELLDFLGHAAVFPKNCAPAEALVTRHRLQAFHPDYFRNPKLHSYSKSNAAASRGVGVPCIETPFFAKPLPGLCSIDHTAFLEVDLNQLAQFFASPSKQLLRQRLGMWLDRWETDLEDSERFILSPLQASPVRESILQSQLAGRPPSSARFIAAGLLPAGALGLAAFKSLESEMQQVIDRVREIVPPVPEGVPTPVDLKLGRFRLHGSLEGLCGRYQLHLRSGTVRARHLLGAWIQHLTRCTLAPSTEGGSAPVALLADKKSLWTLTPVEQPARHLEALLELYAAGMCAPLPFFPESALAFAQAVYEEKRDTAIEKARQAWRGRKDFPGERDDPWFSRCFGPEPLGAEFEGHATGVFIPLLQHRKEGA